MSVKCIQCDQHILSYKERLELAPRPFQWHPQAIECANCGVKLCSRSFSRFLFIVSLLVGLLGAVSIFVALELDMTELTSVLLVSLIFVLCRQVIWPMIITIEKWEPFDWKKEYPNPSWWPRNRIIGYLILFGSPIFIIGGLFLGVAFLS